MRTSLDKLLENLKDTTIKDFSNNDSVNNIIDSVSNKIKLTTNINDLNTTPPLELSEELVVLKYIVDVEKKKAEETILDKTGKIPEETSDILRVIEEKIEEEIREETLDEVLTNITILEGIIKDIKSEISDRSEQQEDEQLIEDALLLYINKTIAYIKYIKLQNEVKTKVKSVISIFYNNVGEAAST